MYRKIAEVMPKYDTFMIHGSAVAVDWESYLFIAKSGTGKSTHTKLWLEFLGSQALIVNDDKPFIEMLKFENGKRAFTGGSGGANVCGLFNGLVTMGYTVHNRSIMYDSICMKGAKKKWGS